MRKSAYNYTQVTFFLSFFSNKKEIYKKVDDTQAKEDEK